MKSRNQSYIIYLLLFIAIVAMVYFNIQKQPAGQGPLNISDVATQIEAGKISRIIVNNDSSLTVISTSNSSIELTSHKEPEIDPRLAIIGPGCNAGAACESFN